MLLRIPAPSTEHAGGNRSYHRPLYYDWTLTKDVSSPAADKWWTLKSDKGAMQFFFDQWGRLTKKQDRKGNTLAYAYTAAGATGKLDTITDVAGRVTNLDYDTDGLLSKITDMAGREHTYTYATVGSHRNLREIRHADGTADETVTVFDYDLDQLVSVTNPRGHTSELNYRDEEQWDEPGPGTAGWAASGAGSGAVRATADSYEGAGSIRYAAASATHTNRATVSETYAAAQAFNAVPQELVVWARLAATPSATTVGRLALTYTADQQVGVARGVAYSQDVVLSNTEWRAIRFRNAQLDPGWKVAKLGVEVGVADGVSGSYTGNVYVDELFVKGVAQYVTDSKPATNTIARYEYDWNARKTKVFRPRTTSGETYVEFEHDRSGQVKGALAPDQSSVAGAATYDEYLRLNTITPAGGTGTTYELAYQSNNSNEVASATNEAGDESTRQGDETNGDTLWALDPRNEARKTTSAFEAMIPTYATDGTGNVTSVATKRYAANANLSDATTRGGGTALRTTKMEYGAGGLTTKMVPPVCAAKALASQPACSTTYAYDTTNKGYLVKITAPAGTGEGGVARVTDFVRNLDGTVASAEEPRKDGSNNRYKTTYVYDGLGRLTQIKYGMQDGTPDHTVSYTLDDNGNITAMADKTGSTSWTYDENNRVTQESRTQDGDTETAEYTYHANGLLATKETLAGSTSSPRVVTYTYDAALRLSSQTDPEDPASDKAIDYGYDARGRRNLVEYPSGAEQQMTYGASGLATLTLKSPTNATLQSFAYDHATGGRHNGKVRKITETTQGLTSSTVTFGYDEYGRLADADRTGQDAYDHTYTYDRNDNRLTFRNGATTQSGAYDDANQLTSWAGAGYTYDRNGNLTAIGTSHTFGYDEANKQTSSGVGSTSLAYGYDGMGRRAYKEVGGSARTDYWYDKDGLGLETGGTYAAYLKDPGGKLLSIDANASAGSTGFMNYMQDRLDSVTATADSSGALVNKHRYDPWGSSIGSSGSGYNPVGFAGTYKDSQTGYYAMGARYYGAGTGRFTQQDPLPSSVFSATRYGDAPSPRCGPQDARSRPSYGVLPAHPHHGRASCGGGRRYVDHARRRTRDRLGIIGRHRGGNGGARLGRRSRG